jgi:cell division protein ZapA (FtsZ GTPase activity inhibitor)
MTPKEKAKELVEKFHIINSIKIAKICALIAVDEMYDIASENNNVQQMNYLVDVKQEIEKL